VASDLPGLSDAVTGATVDGEVPPAGVLIEPGDAAALAGALTRLLTDAGTRGAMGEAAVTRAASYSMDAIGARYVALLLDAAGRDPSSAR
jgi:glycosyltransferase involved in cell wall biosynthesis